MFRNLLLTSAVFAVAGCSMTIGVAADRALTFNRPSALKREVLNPTVRVMVRLKDGVAKGSGTILHSGDDGTFILTNHHVVDQLLKDHVAGEPEPEVQIDSWVFLPGRKSALPLSVHATIASDDEADDLALLRVTDNEFRAEAIADVMPVSDSIDMGETVFAAGGGIGERPFVTQGLLSLTSLVDHGKRDGAILMSAPIIGGNSGGGAYVMHGGRYTFFGVPSALEVAHDSAVPHMALVIPMSVVRPFLVKAGLSEFSTTPAHHRARTTIASAD